MNLKFQKLVENLLRDCIERNIGQHDMMQCRICHAEGHNEVPGHPYGIKHETGCTVEKVRRAAPSKKCDGRSPARSSRR